ncbi:hypothetical protein HYDPIDRAFT_118111 [Hydnomerulius pinastri MD-312]|uniref:Heterokaryon incompatibility domain-containing protein n=1 Tax=Hydnomerulius pinastri MD-312 TaxID=994086 RepID=A0A0C9VQ01_9AGAM|nr:hypothetical protein HYDPIDRAFT_118111 [Hydnomerulius pinastri MD-312]
MFCSKARAYGCRFAWSDTCCINKESSAELDESIRSMFRWYHNAFICIVHLGGSVTIDDVASDEWFTRGWTLQELLAPENIKFFNKDWSPLTGTKNDKDRRNGMLDQADKNPIWRSILSATKIPEGRLGYFSPGAFDVAQRMAWAAGRRTTRVEDMSYALVGIFGVSMPVQYGEGKFAFHRLMEALLQRVNEYGILAWAGPASLHSAALPASLEGYRLAKGIEDCVSVPNEFGDPAMMLTHKGLQVEVLLVPMQSREDEVEGEDSEEDWDDEVSLEEKQGSEPFVPIQNCEEGDSKENEDKGSSAEEEEDSDEADSISATNRDPAPDEADSGSTTDSDSLSVRFLGNDRDQIGGEGPLNQFTLVDEQDNFYTVRVSGRGPIILRGDFVEEIPHQYALAILDYHRDWERGSGCVYVPYEEKSRYLAFVLYRDHVGEVWSKLETDDVVYVEVQPTKRYEGQTVNLCF